MPAKKRAVKDEETAKETTGPNQAQKKVLTAGSSDKQDENVELVNEPKPKKVAKKEEVQPTRRGGDRAAKKAAVENLSNGKNVEKKARSAPRKKSVPAKAATKSRGRVPKTNKAELPADDTDESEGTTAATTTVAVEH